MRDHVSEQFIFRVAAVPSQAFTAATTNIITSNAHGLSNGDCVQVASTTTLPAGLSVSTNYYVIEKTTNTFKLSATLDGTEVDITDTGTGTHTYYLKGHVIRIEDWKNNEINLFTANNSNFTIKFQVSNQEDVDFNAAASSTNRWEYGQIRGLNTANSVDGDTGVVLSGTDAAKQYELNFNGSKWMTAVISSYVAGNLNLTISNYSD